MLVLYIQHEAKPKQNSLCLSDATVCAVKMAVVLLGGNEIIYLTFNLIAFTYRNTAYLQMIAIKLTALVLLV